MEAGGRGRWEVSGGGSVDVTGRLIGGCIETVAHLAGTPYGDVRAWAAGLDEPTSSTSRPARTMRSTSAATCTACGSPGWFDRAARCSSGAPTRRTTGGPHPARAVVDALGRLDLPIVLDLEIGHVPPHLPLVNGALARVVVDGDTREITQHLTDPRVAAGVAVSVGAWQVEA